MNNGLIIIQPERDVTKFTSMGTFLGTAKRIASNADKEILMSKEIGEKLRSEIRAERFNNQDNIYFAKEVKGYSEDNKKFIDRFVKGLNK